MSKHGSTNVYADLGLENAEEMLVKAQLVYKISEIIHSMGLTQVEAARILGCSKVHTSRQNQTLLKEDVHALIDKRQGQKQDYLFSSEIKAELVQQFAANAVTGRPISSRIISEELNKAANSRMSVCCLR